jgi:hypothetical protein
MPARSFKLLLLSFNPEHFSRETSVKDFLIKKTMAIIRNDTAFAHLRSVEPSHSLRGFQKEPNRIGFWGKSILQIGDKAYKLIIPDAPA